MYSIKYMLGGEKFVCKYICVSTAVPDRFKTFMDLLLELGDDGSFTDEEIGDEVDTIILAGTETTAAVLVWTLVMLRNYPDVQARVYKE